MKKYALFFLLLMVLTLCATSHGVGNTNEARKSQRGAQKRVNNQFIGQ